jgi:hypothetical protein
MPTKSFRGLIADTGIQSISLATRDGSTGYRITKFELMPYQMGVAVDSCVKIFKIPQTTTSSTIDLSDNTLLAVGTNYNATYEIDHIIVFDNEIFNQDIYITHHESTGSSPINYYIELEQVKLDLSENTVATLKDIRNITG